MRLVVSAFCAQRRCGSVCQGGARRQEIDLGRTSGTRHNSASRTSPALTPRLRINLSRTTTCGVHIIHRPNACSIHPWHGIQMTHFLTLKGLHGCSLYPSLVTRRCALVSQELRRWMPTRLWRARGLACTAAYPRPITQLKRKRNHGDLLFMRRCRPRCACLEIHDDLSHRAWLLLSTRRTLLR